MPYAVGVAVSPVPIAATLLLLSTPRAFANGFSFLAGWMAGVALPAALLVVLMSAAGLTDADPVWIALAELTLGVGFLTAAAVLWSRRNRWAPEDAPWVSKIDGFTSARSGALGVMLSGAPKVVALALGAALALAQADADARSATQAVALFAAVGAMGVLVPVLLYAAAPGRARRALGRMRAWLGRHETRVLVVLGLLIGALFLGDAAKAL